MSLWAGTYSAKGGAGLYPLERRDGAFVVGVPEPRIANASFGVWSDHHQLAYFVDEQEEGRIGTWQRQETAWQQVGSLASGGALPCYLALSSDGQWLACANYGDGTVAIFGIDPQTGVPVKKAAAFQPSGQGINPERQDGPHAHCVVFSKDDQSLYHVDLGLDCVFRHELREGGIASSHVALAAPPGAGPRHLLLAPDEVHALLICELSAQVLLLRREGTRLICIQTVPTAPEAFDGDNLGGHLAFDANGDVLVTNRGHDSLVRFGLSGAKLTMLGWSRTGGSSPRHIALDGPGAIVAHEESGGITEVPRIGGNGAVKMIADIPGAAFLLDIPR